MKLPLLIIAYLWIFDLIAQPDIQLVPYHNGLSSPTDITFAPGLELMYIAEREGKIIWIDQNKNSGTLINLSTKIRSGNELGLLGLVFHPDFQNNRKMYVNYTRVAGNKWETVIASYTITDITGKIADQNEEILLVFEQPFSNHNGGDLVFGKDGYLYIATGDGGNGGDPLNSGQQLNTLLGKILRLDVNSDTGYVIPSDNPFVGKPGLEEIWLHGLRNPWRFSFDRISGDCWIADVGQNLWEEISVVAPLGGGNNLGWKCFEGFSSFGNCDLIDHHEPVYAYAHNRNCGDNDFCGNSITGGYIYRGIEYPNMYGHYIFADYDANIIWSLTRDTLGNSQVIKHPQDNPITEISTFGENGQGEIWAASLNGTIFRVVDNNSTTTSISTPIPVFQIFPNPAREKITIQSTIDLSEASIECFDFMGRRQSLKLINRGSNWSVDTGSLTSGNYVVFIQGKNLNWRIPTRLIIAE